MTVAKFNHSYSNSPAVFKEFNNFKELTNDCATATEVDHCRIRQQTAVELCNHCREREQDSSPTRQFTDTDFEDISPTELKTIHRNFWRQFTDPFVSLLLTCDQGYRNFEIQIGPLDRWRHKNMSSTIPKSHENSSFSSKSVSEIDYFSDRVQLQPVVSKQSKDNPKSLASDRCLLNTGVHQYPSWCLNPPMFSVSQRVSFFYKDFACV